MTAGWALLLALTTVLAVRAWMEWLPSSLPLSLDLNLFFYPVTRFVGEEYAQGRFPLWNPYLGFGTSWVADLQARLYYPPTLLYALLPYDLAFELDTMLHIVLAAAGTFLLVRAQGLGAAAALVAVVALGSGEPLHIMVTWLSYLSTFSWLPLALYLARRVGDRPSLDTALPLAVVLALQVLASYVQFHLYTVLLLPLFAIPRDGVFSRAMLKVLFWLAIAEIWAAAAGAVALAPSFAWVEESVRHGSALSQAVIELEPVRLVDLARGVATHGLGQHKAPLFFGAVVPLLALAGLLGRGLASRLRVPATILLVAAIVLALGSGTPVYPLLWKLPIAHLLTGPLKWTYFLALAIVLLAAVGADGLLGVDPRRRLGNFARTLWATLGVGVLLLFPFPFVQRVLGGVVLAAVLWLGDRRSPVARRAVLALVLACIAVGGALGFERRAARPRDFAHLFERHAPAFAVARSLQAEGAGRLYVRKNVGAWSIRQAELERVEQANTYETLPARRTFELLGAVTSRIGDEARMKEAVALLRSVGVELFLGPHVLNRWLSPEGFERVYGQKPDQLWRDRAALPRAFLAETVEIEPSDGVIARLAKSRPGQRLAVLDADPALPLEISELRGGEAEIVSSSDTEVRLRVRADGPALLVLLDAWHPDWEASVDGHAVPIRRANAVGRAVALPSGAREVVFRFVPRALYAGAVVSSIAFVCLLGTIAFRCAGRARRSPP